MVGVDNGSHNFLSVGERISHSRIEETCSPMSARLVLNVRTAFNNHACLANRRFERVTLPPGRKCMLNEGHFFRTTKNTYQHYIKLIIPHIVID